MNSTERRQSPRMTLDLPIELEGKCLRLRDVSISGVQIEADTSLAVGSLTEVSLPVPPEYRHIFDGRKQISLRLRVKWCCPQGDSRDLYRAGGPVEAITEQGRQDLHSYMSLVCGPLGEESASSGEGGASNGGGPLLYEERIKALGQLASGIAHDFNNHLMIILGRIQILRMQGAPPELDRHAAKAERAALEAAELVKRLQDLSLNTSPIPMGPVQLNALVEAAVANSQAWAGGHSELSKAVYTFHVDLYRPLLCRGIAADLQNALIGLIKNAMEAMPRGGNIWVFTRQEGGEAVVEITDNGPGLDPMVKEHLFEPFVTTRKGRSRGLGLTIAYGIVRRHNGTIEIQNAPKGGVRCTLRLEGRPVPKSDADSVPQDSLLNAPA